MDEKKLKNELALLELAEAQNSELPLFIKASQESIFLPMEFENICHLFGIETTQVNENTIAIERNSESFIQVDETTGKLFFSNQIVCLTK